MKQNKIIHFYTLSPYITKCYKDKPSCEVMIIIHSSVNSVYMIKKSSLSGPFMDSKI